MTPKEKATELVDIFSDLAKINEEDTTYEYDKKCALICVDEVDNIIQKLTPKNDMYKYLHLLEFYQEVKKEIELL